MPVQDSENKRTAENPAVSAEEELLLTGSPILSFVIFIDALS